MRPSVIKYLNTVLKKHSFMGPIYEMGSLRVSGQEILADMRPYFPNQTFVGCDMRPGLGVDRIENVERLGLLNNSVGTVICLDTLEHVEDVIQAMKEMYRVLKPGGLLVITSVMNFCIHSYPSDYWRFTPMAFQFLLKPFSSKEVVYDGSRDFPTGIYGYGIK